MKLVRPQRKLAAVGAVDVVEQAARRLPPVDAVAEAAVPLLQEVADEEPRLQLQFLQCLRLREAILLTPTLRTPQQLRAVEVVAEAQQVVDSVEVLAEPARQQRAEPRLPAEALHQRPHPGPRYRSRCTAHVEL